MNYEFEKKKLKAYLGKDIYQALKENQCIIAGGMITSLFCNREINDVDVYFRDSESLEVFLTENIKNNQWILSKTDKALLVNWNKLKVQFIYFDTFDNAQDLFNTFDFTVCMGAFDFKTEEFILHNDFLKHNTQKILKFNSNTAYPMVSAFRIDKYKTKGYTISKDEFMRIMLTISLLNINTYEQFKEQVGGMYGINYDKHLKPEKDEEFDLINTIEKMSTLCLNDEYFNGDGMPDFIIEDFDILIAEITNSKIKYFEYKNKLYKCGSSGISRISKDEIEKNSAIYERANLFGDIIKDNKLYKFVMKKDNGYCSFYNPKFEYKINEDVVAENYMGLYCGLYQDRFSFSYAYDDKSVLIELEVKEEDFIEIDTYNLSFKFKKVKFVKEIEEN